MFYYPPLSGRLSYSVTLYLAPTFTHNGVCDLGRMWSRLFKFVTGRNRPAARPLGLDLERITLDDVDRAVTPYAFDTGVSVVPLVTTLGTLGLPRFRASTCMECLSCQRLGGT